MITQHNYFDFVRQNNILSTFPESAPFHEFIVQATDGGRDWSAYDDEPQTKKLIDTYFAKLTAKKNVNQPSDSSSPTSQTQSEKRQEEYSSKEEKRNAPIKSKSRTRNPQTQHKAPKKVAKKKNGRKPGGGNKPPKPKKVLNLPKGKLVELVDPHLLFVGRFLRMNHQNRTRNALEKFFSQINQAADARILRKASPYADHIIYIQKQLLKYLSTGGEEFTIEINSAKFDELLRAVAKEQQMASVRLLKRYHNIAGRPTSIEKAKKLYNELYNAIEKGKIPEQDRLFKRVTKVMRDLLDYVKAEDTNAELVRLPAELGGVLGFMDGCLCRKDREMNRPGFPDDVEVNYRK